MVTSKQLNNKFISGGGGNNSKKINKIKRRNKTTNKIKQIAPNDKKEEAMAMIYKSNKKCGMTCHTKAHQMHASVPVPNNVLESLCVPSAYQ